MKPRAVDRAAVDHVARQLVKLVAEHGTPNSFGCRELQTPAIRPQRIGTVGVRHLDALREALCIDEAPFTVDYISRRFRASTIMTHVDTATITVGSITVTVEMRPPEPGELGWWVKIDEDAREALASVLTSRAVPSVVSPHGYGWRATGGEGDDDDDLIAVTVVTHRRSAS